ncbi:hypothetical protein ACFL6X_01495 [Candidatus Latescibacterota bacterium]
MSEHERGAAMAETNDQRSPVPAEPGWQWAFSYLRQDMQDLRTEIRELRAEINRRMDRTLTVTVSTTPSLSVASWLP